MLPCAPPVLFNSPEFAVFFPLVVAGFYALPHRFRWAWLLIASLAFYMAWRPPYVLVLIALILIDYVAARAMAGCADARARRRYLLLSLAANLGLLFAFKYYGFFMTSLGTLLAAVEVDWRPTPLDLVLPVGLSFHTFQAMSYTRDVYRGRIPAERSLGLFALFVSYFPQLVAGPIERASSLIPQLKKEVAFDFDRVADGLRLMAWGLFKKVVVADRLAAAVDAVYAAPGRHDGPALVVATVLFAVQIYGDFSGYSDMALGAARVLGVRLMDNFRTPYVARSVRDFWQRWHISLTSWFRDYVYVSLGGNRVARPRWAWNVLVVFLLSGLWHGANWTFVLWGAFHGVWMVASRVSEGVRARLVQAIGLRRVPRLHAAIQVFLTFSLVCLGWVLFRAASLSDARLVFAGMGSGWESLLEPGVAFRLAASLGLAPAELMLAFTFAALLFLIEARAGDTPPLSLIAAQPSHVRWPAYYLLVSLILAFGVFDSSPFLYFQF
jgi:D-alanyl-lipoteichoic acid acyltransferase DltB (MBOAT superfamily)